MMHEAAHHASDSAEKLVAMKEIDLLPIAVSNLAISDRHL